jgi:DNA-binding CsgD family transcriptional regulator
VGVTRPAIELLEREAELAALEEAIAAASSGSGRVLVIEGPAGIGKTRLLAAACERADALGLEAVLARAGELERDLGWGVVRELFERALGDPSQEERGQLFSGAAGLASAVLGHGAGSSLPRAADATAPALHGLYWLTVNLAGRRPLLLAVDDAHWADPPSLRFLSYLAVRVEELPLLLALTVRSAEPGADARLVAGLAARAEAEVLRPAPLSEEASRQVIRAALGRHPDPEFARACQAATGGNPFLLGELLRQLARTGVPPTAGETDRVLEARPEGITRKVLVRLSRLPAEARELAAAVAVLGSSASLRHATELAALDDESATAAADALVAANILEPGVPLEFCHPIVRAAVYTELPAIRRAEWHRRAAAILAGAGRPADEVAVHLLAVEPNGDPSVVERLRAAAEDALARGAVQAAVSYLRRALAEPPPPETRAETVRALGSAESRLGDPGAVEHLREALELGRDAGERARTAHELAMALLQGLRSREAVELLETALSTVAEVDRELVLELEAELAAIAYLDVAAAPMVFERIRRLLPEVEEGRTPGERLVLSQLANQLANAGASAERVGELAARALGDGRLLAEQTADSLSFYVVVYALVLADRFELAEAALDDAIADSRARGSAVGFAMASSVRSELDYGRGAVADSMAEARNSIEAREPPLPNALGWLVRALVERGELEAAGRVLRESPYGEELPNLLTFGNLLHAHGELLVAQGKTRQGLELFLEVLRRSEPLGPRRVIAVEGGLAATIAFGALGDTAEARRRAADAVERARAWGTASLLGRCLRVQGLVEGGREGIERLSEAVSLLVESPRRLEHARALVDLGAALRRAGHRREARDPLRQGLDLAYACGATALLERARTELRAAGARPRRVRLTGVDALTPSERRVAEMAAQGLTNREIAQALFVTPRTIETHLGHAYQKLDIGSREELRAALATERGQDRALAGA